MSEELNPSTEETTSTDVAASETPATENASEAPAEVSAEAEAPVAAASETPATENANEAPAEVSAEAEAPVAAAAPAQPEAAPASSAPAEGNVPLGPSEYVPDPHAGGRSRRTSINADINDIHYKNVPLLARFIDQRGRILSRRKTRVSAVMQRRVVKAIKLARHLALLPYTADQTRVVRKRR